MTIENPVLIGLGISSLTGWLFGILVALRGVKRASERSWYIEKLKAQLVRENVDRMALEASNESLTKERNRLRQANDEFQRKCPTRPAPAPYDPMPAMLYHSLASAPTPAPAPEPSCRASSYESGGGGDFGGAGASSSWSDSSSSSDSSSASSSSSD